MRSTGLVLLYSSGGDLLRVCLAPGALDSFGSFLKGVPSLAGNFLKIALILKSRFGAENILGNFLGNFLPSRNGDPESISFCQKPQ